MPGPPPQRVAPFASEELPQAALPWDADDLSYGPCFGPLVLDEATRQRLAVSPGSYEVVGFLARTANSEVHRAKLDDGTLMVVKRVNKRTSRQPFQMHVNEVRTLGRLQHPCIVRMLGIVDGTDALDILLEYCPKGHLLNYAPKATNRLLLKVALDLATALAYMHGERFVHLDVKPDNVLVSSSGHGKLCDFGTATRIGSSGLLCGLVGTPGYRAPEMEQGGKYDAAAADVWSLGKVAQVMLIHSQSNWPWVQELVDFRASRRPTAAKCTRLVEASLDCPRETA